MWCNAISAVSVRPLCAEDGGGGQEGLCCVHLLRCRLHAKPLHRPLLATKSFVSAFAAGIAAEVKSSGVDVLVVHPSVATRFYDKAHKMDMLDFFKNFSVDPTPSAADPQERGPHRVV